MCQDLRVREEGSADFPGPAEQKSWGSIALFAGSVKEDLSRFRPSLSECVYHLRSPRCVFRVTYLPAESIYRIRAYRSEDFNELWRLDQECFAPAIAYSRFELMHYIRAAGSLTLVAENAASEIAGFLIVERGARSKARLARNGGGRRGHIVTIDVRTSARRGGLGTLLMTAAESRMTASGCDVIFLEVSVENTTAIDFYRRLGYEAISTIPRYYDNLVDALVMAKRLRVPPNTAPTL